LEMQIEIGRVLTCRQPRPGLWEAEVSVAGRTGRALAYDSLVGPLQPGDRVLLNTTAVALRLGTGGVHFVLWVLGREKGYLRGPGHLMKMRYTPLQVKVQGWEETARAFPEGLGGMPVLVGSLHSQLGGACAGYKAVAGRSSKLAYLMSDGGALPAWYSELLARLRSAGLVDHVITCGHAFGGDQEAVNAFSGLLAARAWGAEAVVACMGPGVVGTGTVWGTTALEMGQMIDAASILGGRPVAIVRMGFGDPRARHRGVSHHVLTVLGRVAQRRCLVALPHLPPDIRVTIMGQLERAGVLARHGLAFSSGERGIQLLRREGIPMTTMNRGFEEEPHFFRSAGAAGEVAAMMVKRRETVTRDPRYGRRSRVHGRKEGEA